MNINQELEKNLPARVSIIVFLKNIRNQYRLRRYGDIVYFSKKMHYCIIYVNQDNLKQVVQEIEKLDFVKRVTVSQNDELNLDANHIQKQIERMAQIAESKLEKNEVQQAK